MENKKVCKACLAKKDGEDFCKAKWSKDGRNTVCKKCIKNKMPILKGVLKIYPLCEENKDEASFYANEIYCRKCIVSSAVQQKKIGAIYVLNSGDNVEIIEYISKYAITIKFDSGVILSNITMEAITGGWLKNPMMPSVCGIGYMGVGKYDTKNSLKIYNTWNHIINRCYAESSKEKYPTYIGCTVDPRWHNFQVFAEWFEQNYKENFHLDKDVLLRGNKIYVSDTCCFVPYEINNFIKGSYKSNGLPVGVTKIQSSKYQVVLCGKYLGVYNSSKKASDVYNTAKEIRVKEMADKWKEKLELKVYEALCNYTVVNNSIKTCTIQNKVVFL